jgi:hypothetical protein
MARLTRFISRLADSCMGSSGFNPEAIKHQFCFDVKVTYFVSL